MHAISEIITKIMPSWLKDRLRASFGDFFRFNHSLSSGILITLRRPSDFSTFSEIFVDGFYDKAIHEAIRNSKEQINLLDLGSNVGFFAHRFADILRSHYSEAANGKKVKITMVEGMKTVAEESRFRMENNRGKVGECEIIHGLVGRKSGFASISSQYNYGYNTIIEKSQSGAKKRTDYYNLENKLTSTQFDLIKCDIEGAEEVFIETYLSLLARQPRMVFEFHHKMCDTSKCDRMLKEQGFKACEIYANDDISMVYYFH